MENERLAKLEEKCERIPHIEQKLDAFIADEQKRREAIAFKRGKFAGVMISVSAFVSLLTSWWVGHK